MTLPTLTLAILGAVCLAAVVEIVRLRLRERRLVSREALVEARHAVAAERSALEEAKIKQSFEEGVLEGLKRAAGERSQDESYRLGYEKGLIEGERNAEDKFHIEYWTEVKKNQGYLFTSAEIVACYQLMYKNMPIGLPQKHTVEQSETIDRKAMDQMFNRILGPAALGGQAAVQGIRVVSRDENTVKALKSKG